MRDDAFEREIHAVAGELSRRRFIALAGGVVAAGFLPASCEKLPDMLKVPRGLTLKVMAPWEYALINAVARRMVGEGPAKLIDSRKVDPAAYLDETLTWVDRRSTGDLRKAFGIVEFSPWPLLPKWGRFTTSHAETQDRVLRSLENSRSHTKRAIFVAFKLLSGPAFYAQPGAWADIRYPGPPWNAPDLHKASVSYPSSWAIPVP